MAEEICKSLEQTILKYFPQIETDVDRPKSSSALGPSPTKEAADLVHFIARTNRVPQEDINQFQIGRNYPQPPFISGHAGST